MESYGDVLHVGEVAELLGMSVDDVRRLAREGRIPAYQMPAGRVYRFLCDEVEEWRRGDGQAVPARR